MRKIHPFLNIKSHKSQLMSGSVGAFFALEALLLALTPAAQAMSGLGLDPQALLSALTPAASVYCQKDPSLVPVDYVDPNSLKNAQTGQKQLILTVNTPVEIDNSKQMQLFLVLKNGSPIGLLSHPVPLYPNDPSKTAKPDVFFSRGDIAQGAVLNKNSNAVVLRGTLSGDQGQFVVDYLVNFLDRDSEGNPLRHQCSLQLSRSSEAWVIKNSQNLSVNSLNAEINKMPFIGTVVGIAKLDNCDPS